MTGSPLTVVVAPDSFKGSLSALEAASAIAVGWLSVRPEDQISTIPQADGGEGTLDAIEAAVPGTLRHDVGPVTGPDGRPTPGRWLELPGGIGVVETAQSSGLPLMRTLDPLGATTFGLGEVIRSAVAHGIDRLVIGLGGSASTDGGAGALAALGLVATGEIGDGEEGRGALERGGWLLAGIVSLDRSRLIAPPPGGVILLADVTAPLLGPSGAAAVFGPQKGASEPDVAVLDSALAHFADLLGGNRELAGTGAAGGAAFGFVAAWGAVIEPGAEYLAKLTGLPEAMAEADVLLTGEGRFDATSASGKLVGELIRMAGRNDVRAGLIAGQISVPPTAADGSPLWSTALVDLAGSIEGAQSDPARWLREAGAAAASAFGS